MSTIITRLFESQEQAMKAVAELRRRIREDSVTGCERDEAPGGGSREGRDLDR